jgi:hypothetical protein
MYELDVLAHGISTGGIEAHDAPARAFADWAYRRGFNPTVAAVLADSTAPSVARERAFGRLAAAVRFGQPAALEVA